MNSVKVVALIWDDFNIAHIARHDVEVREVETALKGSKTKAMKAKNGRVLALGRAGKRLLTIVLAKEIDSKFYVVTARDMSKSERRYYRSEQT